MQDLFTATRDTNTGEPIVTQWSGLIDGEFAYLAHRNHGRTLSRRYAREVFTSAEAAAASLSPVADSYTGVVRSQSEVEDALRFISEQLIKYPLAMSPAGFPYTIHFTVIRHALQELLARRARGSQQ